MGETVRDKITPPETCFECPYRKAYRESSFDGGLLYWCSISGKPPGWSHNNVIHQNDLHRTTCRVVGKYVWAKLFGI